MTVFLVTEIDDLVLYCIKRHPGVPLHSIASSVLRALVASNFYVGACLAMDRFDHNAIVCGAIVVYASCSGSCSAGLPAYPAHN